MNTRTFTAVDYDTLALMRALWFPRPCISAYGKSLNLNYHQLFTDEMVEVYGLSPVLDTSDAVAFDAQSFKKCLIHPLVLAAMFVVKKLGLPLDCNHLRRDTLQCLILVEAHKSRMEPEHILSVLNTAEHSREFFEARLPESLKGASFEILSAWFALQQLVPPSMHINDTITHDVLLDLMGFLERRDALRHLAVFLKTPSLLQALERLQRIAGLFNAILIVLDELPEGELRAARINELLLHPYKAPGVDRITEYARFICLSVTRFHEYADMLVSDKECATLFVRFTDAQMPGIFPRSLMEDLPELKALLLRDDVPTEMLVQSGNMLLIRSGLHAQEKRYMAYFLLKRHPDFIWLLARRGIHNLLTESLQTFSEQIISLLTTLDRLVPDDNLFKKLAKAVVNDARVKIVLSQLLEINHADFRRNARMFISKKPTGRLLAFYAVEESLPKEFVAHAFSLLAEYWDDVNFHSAMVLLLNKDLIDTTSLERIAKDESFRHLLAIANSKNLDIAKSSALENPDMVSLLLRLLECFPVTEDKWPEKIVEAGAKFLSVNDGRMPSHAGLYPALCHLVGCRFKAWEELIASVFVNPDWCAIVHVITNERQIRCCLQLMGEIDSLRNCRSRFGFDDFFEGEDAKRGELLADAILNAATSEASEPVASMRFAAFSEKVYELIQETETQSSESSIIKDTLDNIRYIFIDMQEEMEYVPSLPACQPL